MKSPICFVIPVLVLALVMCSCDNGTDSSDVTPVSYKVYEKYYYRGPRPQTDSTLFFLTTGKPAFDALFIYLDDNPPYDTIPRADLSTKSAISVVKYGNDSYRLEVSLVYLRGDSLEIEYTSTLVAANMSFTVAHSMIVMADASFRGVKFIENGLLVRRM